MNGTIDEVADVEVKKTKVNPIIKLVDGVHFIEYTCSGCLNQKACGNSGIKYHLSSSLGLFPFSHDALSYSNNSGSKEVVCSQYK
ncbi:MAG: hypothetical protein WC755_00620 [Candidatus Woesearchaeota archaeon]|jgi:hypothetical protein